MTTDTQKIDVLSFLAGLYLLTSSPKVGDVVASVHELIYASRAYVKTDVTATQRTQDHRRLIAALERIV